jgi:excinuclease UvrABC ATPase subunit
MCTTGCFKSEEQKKAEKTAERQAATIYTRKSEGQHEMYAELNDKDRRWVESGMRQTTSSSSKDKDEAYAILTSKMEQGSWVWNLVEEKCSECDGLGYVVYDENSFFVINNLAEQNVKYNCSICGGTGVIVAEVKEFDNEE